MRIVDDLSLQSWEGITLAWDAIDEETLLITLSAFKRFMRLVKYNLLIELVLV